MEAVEALEENWRGERARTGRKRSLREVTIQNMGQAFLVVFMYPGRNIFPSRSSRLALLVLPPAAPTTCEAIDLRQVRGSLGVSATAGPMLGDRGPTRVAGG